MFVFDVDLKTKTCKCCGERVVPLREGHYRHLRKPSKKCALDSTYNSLEDEEIDYDPNFDGKIRTGSGKVESIGLISAGCPVCGKALTSVYKDYRRVGYCHSPYKEGGYDL